MTVENVELGYWDWLSKITERLTFARLKVGDRKDISEEDYGLLKVLFPIWYNGEFPFFINKMEGLPISATQASIFDNVADTTAEFPNGTDIDYGFDEPNLDEK